MNTRGTLRRAIRRRSSMHMAFFMAPISPLLSPGLDSTFGA
jgi:hypothetical protein